MYKLKYGLDIDTNTLYRSEFKESSNCYDIKPE